MKELIVTFGMIAACHLPAGEGVDAAAGADAATGTTATIQLTASYPSYDTGGSGYICSSSVMQPINIYAPVAPAGTKLPLLLFFPGTLATATDGVSLTIIERAAQLGFVAAAIEYHSWDILMWPDRMDAKERCVFESDISTPDNAIDQLCNNQGPLATSNAQVDCSRGIVAVGHSQGGYMALLAKNYDPRVRAAYILDTVAYNDQSSACTDALAPGYDIACNMFTAMFPYTADPATAAAQLGAFGGPALGAANHRVLPSSAVVSEAGDIDPYFVPGAAAVTAAEVAVRLNDLEGLSCGAGPSCAGPAGGGWIEVDASQLDTALEVPPFAGAGHCWFSDGNDLGCTNGTYIPDPNYGAPGATAGWTLDANLRWLATFTGP
jgi:dienelactone hydrolase